MDPDIEYTFWKLKPGIPGLSPRDLKFYKTKHNVEHVVIANSDGDIVQVSSPSIGKRKRRKPNVKGKRKSYTAS